MAFKPRANGGRVDGRWTGGWDMLIVFSCRLVIVTCVFCACIWHREMDGYVDTLYQALRSSSVFQHDSFEVWKRTQQKNVVIPRVHTPLYIHNVMTALL